MTNRIQPRVAFKAIKALIQDPDQTEQVFIFVDAMAGDARLKNVLAALKVRLQVSVSLQQMRPC